MVAGVLSGVLAALILAVSFLAVSPELHMALHGHEAIEAKPATSSCEHDHGHDHSRDHEPSESHETCAVCLFAHASVMQSDVATPALKPIYQLTIAVMKPESLRLILPRFILLPERAPPSLG